MAAQLIWATGSASTTTKSSTGSYLPFLLIAGFGVVYFFVLRPRSQKQKQQREQLRAAVVGDEIQTVGGLVGTIVSEDGDRVTVSTGNGTELTFIRAAINKKIEPPAPDVPDTSAEFEGTPPGLGSPPDVEEPEAK